MSSRLAIRLACGALLLSAVGHAALAGQDAAPSQMAHGDVLYTPSYIDPYEACYRYGRCSAAELRALRERAQRIDRVTPRAPEAAPVQPPAAKRDVQPTPEENILPQYRDASRVRDEYARPAKP